MFGVPVVALVDTGSDVTAFSYGSRQSEVYVICDAKWTIRIFEGSFRAMQLFQRYLITVFWPMMRESIVMVYMDDVIVPAANEVENLERVRRVLDVAQENGLEIRFDKCNFVLWVWRIISGNSPRIFRSSRNL